MCVTAEFHVELYSERNKAARPAGSKRWREVPIIISGGHCVVVGCQLLGVMWERPRFFPGFSSPAGFRDVAFLQHHAPPTKDPETTTSKARIFEVRVQPGPHWTTNRERMYARGIALPAFKLPVG